MTTTLDHLTAWALLQKQKAHLEDNLHRLFGTDHDSIALRTLTTMWDAHTKAVSQLVGDECAWLDYFEYECLMGKSPGSWSKSVQGVTRHKKNPPKKHRIATLKQLAAAIKATREKP
jgi:hypothetical protein